MLNIKAKVWCSIHNKFQGLISLLDLIQLSKLISYALKPKKRVSYISNIFVLPIVISGDNALHNAALGGNVEIVKLLIKSGVPLQETNNKGK